VAMRVDLQAFGGSDAKTVVVFVGGDLKPPAEAAIFGTVESAIARVAAVEQFTGKAQSVLTIAGATDLTCARLVVIGLGSDKDAAKRDWVMLGGAAAGKAGKGKAVVIGSTATGPLTAAQTADIGLGVLMRGYRFDAYKTKTKSPDDAGDTEVTIQVAGLSVARKAFKTREAIADGVNLARMLVNEPPNVIYPETFAEKAAELKKVGVKVEILDQKALKKLGMRALLGVGQGSHRKSRVAIMHWNGADAKTQPVAFVGKGVTFDTGGISIKPAGGMEDMKGDMAGAACVTGLMHTLAARKAKVNAIGIIGLVENMPDGKAQRPGDIVTSMSGQTIEIINTDAEGRLVLADILWHTQAAFKPKFMVNLATLTGAIMVALGQEHAGLFSNNDELAERLAQSGKATGEKVWRMPLDPAYDKIIDSKFADVKNSGGRYGGAITAAQFLQRFVNDCPWAHLDIAGTGMASNQTDINASWGSGWGVRLLNDLVERHYEEK
jgi:leucyl aminopeptidase